MSENYLRKIQLFRFYYSKRCDGDAFFSWGRSFIARFKSINSDTYISIYGYAIHFGPFHIVIGDLK